MPRKIGVETAAGARVEHGYFVRFQDPDAVWMSNWQEWLCGTSPTNALSALALLRPSASASGITIGWQSVGH